MILIDLIFLSILINAVIGTAYMRCWVKYSKRLEKRSEYGKVYQLLRIAILFFLLPGVWFLIMGLRLVTMNGTFLSVAGLPVAGLSVAGLAGKAVLIVLFAASLLWAAGVVCCTYRYIKEVHSFCKICRYNTEIKNEQLKEYFVRICKRQHIYKGVTIYANPTIRVPMIFGILRRTILLPEKCDKPEELQIILEHEMIHAKHNDLLLERIAVVIRMLIWFVPAPRQLLDEMEEWSETICDISVCGSEASVWSKKEYFNLLIQWAQEARTAEIGTAMALSGESSSIKTRILRIRQYENDLPMSGKKDISHIWLFCLCVCLTVGVALGIQKLGNGIYAQITTANLMEQISGGNGWNFDVKLRGGRVINTGKHSARLMYMKQGEAIEIYYEAEENRTSETEVLSEESLMLASEDGTIPVSDNKSTFGMLGMRTLSGNMELEVPANLGQEDIYFRAEKNGWYVLSIENKYLDEKVAVNYIVMKK